MMASLWRQAFDAVERPSAAAAESWIQSETFMDLAALAVRIQRRLGDDIRHTGEQWLQAWGLASRADIVKLMTDVGNVTRELRDLRTQVAQRDADFRAGQTTNRDSA
jgi:hypothetical protein